MTGDMTGDMTGKEEIFLQMLRDNESRLKRVCRIYAPDAESRRDLYQEILVQAWRSLPGFEGKSQPGTWIYRIALNTALTQKRSRAARPELLQRDPELHHAANASQPAEKAETDERLDALFDAIADLPDMDKALVLLHLDDTSYRDIAGILGISESNVGVKLHRIRRQLTDKLEEQAS